MRLKHSKQYIKILSTETVSLNPEDFRNISKPYRGNSDNEFKEYLLSNFNKMMNSDLLNELNKSTITSLCKLFDDTKWVIDHEGNGADWLEQQ